MILSEKEIEGLALGFITEEMLPNAFERSSAMRAAAKTAHAIAKKMAKGVAWTSERGHFRIQHLVEPDETCIDGDMALEDIVMPGHIGEDGQRVTVTVSFCDPYPEEEEDGQGATS